MRDYNVLCSAAMHIIIQLNIHECRNLLNLEPTSILISPFRENFLYYAFMYIIECPANTLATLNKCEINYK